MSQALNSMLNFGHYIVLRTGSPIQKKDRPWSTVMEIIYPNSNAWLQNKVQYK